MGARAGVAVVTGFNLSPRVEHAWPTRKPWSPAEADTGDLWPDNGRVRTPGVGLKLSGHRGASLYNQRMRIGVLALQGAFREHAAVLRRLGVDVTEVRLPEQLDGLDGLVIPGGESTAMLRLMGLYGLDEAIRVFERPIFGTCAGLIVLDRDRLGLIDITSERNAFGRQVASFETTLAIAGDDEPFTAVFIRAPWITEAGPGVAILAEVDGHPVLAREGRILVASFHPELTDDPRVHERFLEIVREEQSVRA